MKIIDILGLENGKTYSCLDLHVIVKKPKSKLALNGEWTQEVVLSDATGEIQAEVALQTYDSFVSSLSRGQKIEIIEAQLQTGAEGLRLYVFSYFAPTATEPEPYQSKEQQEIHYTPAEIEQNGKPDWNLIARGKTRCNLVCAGIMAGQVSLYDNIQPITATQKTSIEILINYIFEGK